MHFHDIWITRCWIIYKKFSDRVEIEEKVELMNDLRAIINNSNQEFLPSNNRTLNLNQIYYLSSSEIKKILFSYYNTIEDINVYKEMNLRSK